MLNWNDLWKIYVLPLGREDAHVDLIKTTVAWRQETPQLIPITLSSQDTETGKPNDTMSEL